MAKYTIIVTGGDIDVSGTLAYIHGYRSGDSTIGTGARGVYNNGATAVTIEFKGCNPDKSYTITLGAGEEFRFMINSLVVAGTDTLTDDVWFFV